jgi:hypothetical protein
MSRPRVDPRVDNATCAALVAVLVVAFCAAPPAGAATWTAGSGFLEGRPGGVSGDGRYVVFTSEASDLVPGVTDGNAGPDVFLYDRVTDTVTLVSHAAGSATTAGDDESEEPVISADGAWVAFASWATDLVAGQSEGNTGSDVFLYERATGTVTLVSHDTSLATKTGDGLSQNPVINSDGAWVAFQSYAGNLVAGQTNGNSGEDVFLYGRTSGTNTVVSHIPAPTTTTGNSTSTLPAISSDGQRVAFESRATDLVASMTKSFADKDVFLYDRGSGTVTLASHVPAPTTTTGNGYSYRPAISGNGQWVAFQGTSSDLASMTKNNSQDNVFLYNCTSGAVTLVSHAAGSATATGDAGQAHGQAISSDGAWVAFDSQATDHVNGQSDTNSVYDIFLFHNDGSGTITLVSHLPGAPTTTANGTCSDPAISADGGWVAFPSGATNQVTSQSDSNGDDDVFLYERASGTVTLVSHVPAAGTTTGNGYSNDQVINGDGTWVAFTSMATDLVNGLTDTNGEEDVFLWGRDSGSVSPASASGGPGGEPVPALDPTGLALLAALLGLAGAWVTRRLAG